MEDHYFQMKSNKKSRNLSFWDVKLCVKTYLNQVVLPVFYIFGLVLLSQLCYFLWVYLFQTKIHIRAY